MGELRRRLQWARFNWDQPNVWRDLAGDLMDECEALWAEVKGSSDERDGSGS